MASSDWVFILHTKPSIVYSLCSPLVHLWQCGTTPDPPTERFQRNPQCLWGSSENYLLPRHTPDLGTPQLQRNSARFCFTMQGHSEDQAFAGQTIRWRTWLETGYTSEMNHSHATAQLGINLSKMRTLVIYTPSSPENNK